MHRQEGRRDKDLSLHLIRRRRRKRGRKISKQHWMAITVFAPIDRQGRKKVGELVSKSHKALLRKRMKGKGTAY